MMKKLAYLILVLLLLIGGGYYYLINVNNYQLEGRFELSVNDEPIKVYRDANGIAYIFGESKADVIRGQGFVLAQDRLFQLAFYRALINGELAKYLGASMFDSDVRMRVLNLRGNAERNLQLLDQEALDFLTWYCEGYNEYLRVGGDELPAEMDLLGLPAEELTPQEIMTIIHYIGYNHGQNMEDEILSLNLAARMDNAESLLPLNQSPDRSQPLPFELDSISLEPSLQMPIGLTTPPKTLLPAPTLGSNNWVVSGERSSSGKPIVCNDPHLDARLFPGIFYPIGLFGPDFKAVGAALPGIPGIMVGRNENVAFGITNGYGDSQDLFIENEVSESQYLSQGEPTDYQVRTEIIEVKEGKPVKIKVRSTNNGPVISDFPVFNIRTEDVVSLRWTQAHSQSTSLGVEQFLEVEDAAAFREALADMDNMFLNFVFADQAGSIAHQATGLIPDRAAGVGYVPNPVEQVDSAWLGFLPKNDLPNMINPARGWVGTANHDTRPEGYPHYYSSHFSPDFRYKRIKELLAEGTFDATQLWEMIFDCKNMQAQEVVPLLIEALSESEQHQDFVDLLSTWEYMDEAQEVGATIYHVLFDELLSLIMNDELPNEMEELYWGNRYYWAQNLHSVIMEEQPYVDNVQTPNRETLAELILMAADRTRQKLSTAYGEDPSTWTWGKIHTIRFSSPLRQTGVGSEFLGAELLAKNGSNETLNRGAYAKDFEGTFETEWFSSFRMVADLNDDEKIRAVVSGGSAARVFHPYYKSQLEAWKQQEWLPYWFAKNKVEEHAIYELILE